MMRSLLFFLPFITGGLFFSCNRKKPIETIAPPYVLKIKGSDTEFEMVKKLCTAFKESDSLDFIIEGGGTEIGFKALINGQADMAAASREMSEKEEDLLNKKGINALPIMFATDAVAIITNARLGVDSLTVEQVSKIYKGEINNWKEVGGPDRKITLYTRNNYSGTYFYFKTKVTHGEINPVAIVCETSKKITEYVEKDSCGIGYVGAGFLMDENGKPSGKIWAMPLSLDSKHPSYSPYQAQEVKNGNYPLTRPLFQYFKLPLNNKVKDFILFELALKGQAVIRRFGYFPISDYQKEINKLNGFNL